MSHKDYVEKALTHFTPEQLAENYVDTTLDESDQETMTLSDHILHESENWFFASHSMSCDVRSASSVEDILDYIGNSLEKVA